MPIDHAGGDAFQRDEFIAGNWPFIVDGFAERVHHAPDHGIAHGHAHDAPGALDLVAFLDLGVLAEQHDADLIFLQVHGNAGHAVRESKQFASHDLVESIDARDAVTQSDDGAGLVHGDLGFIVLDLLADQFRDFVCP